MENAREIERFVVAPKGIGISKWGPGRSPPLSNTLIYRGFRLFCSRPAPRDSGKLDRAADEQIVSGHFCWCHHGVPGVGISRIVQRFPAISQSPANSLGT